MLQRTEESLWNRFGIVVESLQSHCRGRRFGALRTAGMVTSMMGRRALDGLSQAKLGLSRCRVSSEAKAEYIEMVEKYAEKYEEIADLRLRAEHWAALGEPK